jgi:Uma2 family endonuclease
MSVEEYLHTPFDDGDHEYVDGRIEERNLGELDHSKLQKRLIELLESKGLFAIQEVRLRVSATRYRVPDVQAYQSEPQEQVFTAPPLLVAEVLSPEDRVGRMYEKFEDYQKMGIQFLYLIDPQRKSIQRFQDTEFRRVEAVCWDSEPGSASLPRTEIWPA